MLGTITKILEGKGYGFIRIRGEKRETFFHCYDLANELDFGPHLLNLEVEFELGVGPKGSRARGIRPATSGATK